MLEFLSVHFPDTERAVLESVLRATADRKLRDRLQAVLMAARGLRPAEIMQTLQVSTRTVPRWLNAYLERGLDGLWPGKAKGTKPKVPASLADEVKA
ncbi:MAG: helix-turn-helix domain-containing protein [Gemmataceae bacterium]